MSLDTTEAPDGRTRRRQRNAALIYDAANELLASRPFEALSVDDICAQAGVGRATFFRIFDTKAGLLREFNRRLAREAAARISAAGPSDAATMLHYVRTAVYDAWAEAGPGEIRMAQEFARAAPSIDPHSAHPELLELVVDIVTGAIDAGELSDAVPADLAASLALTHIIAPMSYVMTGQDVDLGRLSRLLLEQWLRGMRVSK